MTKPTWMSPFLYGFGGCLAAIFIFLWLAAAWVVWQRAAMGAEAFQIILRAQQQQQQPSPQAAPQSHQPPLK